MTPLTRPYYQDDLVTIYHGDCREIAPHLSYSAVVTDPPYGISYNREDVPQSKHTFRHGRQTTPVLGDDQPFDPSPWISQPAILWGANYFSDRLPPGVWIVWDKVVRNGLRLRIAEAELAWTNCVARTRIFRMLWSGAYRVSERGQYYHPTQKPVDLMRWCIPLVRPVPRVILDPFMGSGSTLVAAKSLGRRAIGIEIEERYCEIAARRCAQDALPLGVVETECPQEELPLGEVG